MDGLWSDSSTSEKIGSSSDTRATVPAAKTSEPKMPSTAQATWRRK